MEIWCISSMFTGKTQAHPAPRSLWMASCWLLVGLAAARVGFGQPFSSLLFQELLVGTFAQFLAV
jgi:hypothetical protein